MNTPLGGGHKIREIIGKPRTVGELAEVLRGIDKDRKVHSSRGGRLVVYRGERYDGAKSATRKGRAER